MAANIEQKVEELLDRYPEARRSFNRLVFTYWLKVDGYGTTLQDFDRTTNVESILRESRQVFRRRPELSPEANLFPAAQSLFDGLVTVGLI